MQRKAQILVVDDEDEFLGLLKEFLTDHGYEVLTAADGVQAELICDDLKPDLVILDILMPRQEGIETMKNILKKHSQMHIITVSGAKYAPAYLQATEALGADHVFQKPFDLKQLLLKVHALLGPQEQAA